MTLSVDEVAELMARSESDDADASLQLAMHFDFGGDLARAEQFYVTAFAQGASTALLGLADLHVRQENFIAAIAEWKLACDRGHGLACLRLSMAFGSGDYGLAKDAEMASYYLDRTKTATSP